MFLCSSEPLVWCKFGINWTPNLSFAKSLRGFKENRKTNKQKKPWNNQWTNSGFFVCFFLKPLLLITESILEIDNRVFFTYKGGKKGLLEIVIKSHKQFGPQTVKNMDVLSGWKNSANGQVPKTCILCEGHQVAVVAIRHIGFWSYRSLWEISFLASPL